MSTPLHQSNELVFQMSPYPHKISEDLVLGHASLDVTVSDNIIKKGKNRQPKLVAGGGSENSCSMNSKSGNEKKKEILMKHREIERLRRQEMAALYASLRSLLPLELIKVKKLMRPSIVFLSLHTFSSSIMIMEYLFGHFLTREEIDTESLMLNTNIFIL